MLVGSTGDRSYQRGALGRDACGTPSVTSFDRFEVLEPSAVATRNGALEDVF
jgi:hypothetical protein